MNKLLYPILMVFIITACPVWAEQEQPTVTMETTKGNITIELNPQAAPKTVENFLQYVNAGYYNETIFHRVIRGFMIQGGGLTADLTKKSTKKPVLNEADNGLQNTRGTIAMARTQHPHSATSQFFINTADNPFLNHSSKTGRGWGYCVFGKVIKGMEVIDAIEKVPTGFQNGRGDVPVIPVLIKKITIENQAP